MTCLKYLAKKLHPSKIVEAPGAKKYAVPC
jgi:hypothetical protein